MTNSYHGRNYDASLIQRSPAVSAAPRHPSSVARAALHVAGLGFDLGSLQRLGEFDLGHPAVQKKIRERYGTNVPLDEPVISPAAIADSPLLEKVLEE
jgi:hypothetical protein